MKFMNVLKAMLKYQAKCILSKKYIIPILILVVLSLGFVQYGISDYKNLLNQKVIFQDIETNMIDLYATYRHYATYGFRVLFLPAPLSILFTNSTVLQDMNANIESGHRLNIYKPLKGKAVFEINKSLFADFAGILLFLSSLIALLYGYTAFPGIELQSFLASLTSVKRLFFSTLLARAIMLALVILLVIAAAILLINLNGIPIGIDSPLLSYYIEICGVAFFFLVLGAVFGAFEFHILQFISAVGSWFSFLFIVPFIVSIIVAASSDFIKPEYQLEIEKLKTMMAFEKRSIQKYGIFEINKNATVIQQKIILDYYENEFPKMQKLEEVVKIQMQEITDLHFRLSSFFPTTRYMVFANEISSKGYKTLYIFYEAVQQIKEAFFKEYIAKVYFSSQPVKVEPFLKKDENIFKGKPELPGYYLQGLIFNFLWIAVLVMISYFRDKKILFELPENKKDDRHYDVKLQSKSFKSWRIFGPLFYMQMYNLLSGEGAALKKKKYDFQVHLDGRELNKTRKKQNFLALCHPTKIPGHINVTLFITLIMDLLKVDKAKRKEIETRYSLTSLYGKCFRRLDIDEMGRVFLAILDMKILDIYLLNDIGRDMPIDFCIALKDRMDALQESGALVLFLYSDTDYLVLKKDKKPNIYFSELYYWNNVVEEFKQSQ